MLDTIFGASRPYKIPEQFQTYEGISSIEFIHCPKEPADFKSFAYRPTAEGAQLRRRVEEEGELSDDVITVEEARRLIADLAQAGMFSWKPVYRLAQGSFTIVNTNWRLKVEFSDVDGAKAPKDMVCEGEEMTPDNYEAVVDVFMGA